MTRMNWKQRAWLSLVTLAGLSILIGVASAQDQAAHDEDAPAISGQAGYSVLCVRNDAGTVLAGTTGDYINCTTDGNGRIYVNAGAATISSPVGAGTAAAAVRATLASDDPAVASLAIIDNLTQTVSATFTPAATSHTAGDVVGAAASFAALGPSGTTVVIASASLEIDNTAAPATAWRLYLYNVTPPSAIADDAAWDLPSGDRGTNVCFVDLPSTATDQGSTQYVRVEGANVACKLSGTGLFGYLVNLTTATLTASAHIVTISAVPF